MYLPGSMLDGLAEESIFGLIRILMEAAGKAVTAQLEDFIYRLVGGHPLALQIACRHAAKNPGDLNEIESGTRQELEAYFVRCWHDLSQFERNVLMHPGEMGLCEDNDPALRKILRDLTRNSLLVSTGGSYRYPSKAWEAFVNSQA